MKSALKGFLLALFAFIGMVGCGEMPNAPNFRTENSINLPLTQNKTFVLIGEGNDVLIDTTSEEFSDVFDFDTDPNSPTYGLVSIGQVEQVDDISLDDAVPEVSLSPSSIRSEIGEISVDNIDLVVDVTAAEILGFTPVGSVSIPIPTTQNISKDFDIEGLTSFTIANGGFALEVTNNTGLNYSQVDAQLFSNNVAFGPVVVFENLNDGTTQTQNLIFNPGDVAQDLEIRFEIQILSQNATGPYDNLSTAVDPLDLELSEAQLAPYRLENQTFSSVGTIDFENDGVDITADDQYVLLSGGQLRVSDIENSLSIGIESLVIESDYLVKPDGTSFRLSFEGNADGPDGSLNYQSIQPNETPTSRPEIFIDLTGYRVKAFDPISGTNNVLSYSVSGATPSSLAGSNSIPFSASSAIQTVLSLESLTIGEVLAQINPNEFNLKADQNGDNAISLNVEGEYESTIIDAFDDVREDLANIELRGSSMNFDFTHNLGIDANIYLVIVGLTPSGEEVYLSSTEFNANEAELGTRVLFNNGQPVPAENLIKISVDPVGPGETRTQRILFSPEQSTVEEFINLLPSEIRFIGRSIASPDGSVGLLSTPIQFEASFSVEVPLSIVAAADEDNPKGSSVDPIDIDVDLTSLPSPEDANRIVTADLIINYTNGLPLTLDMEVDFLRADSSVVFTYPQEGQAFLFSGAAYDEVTGFSTVPTEGQILFSLNQQQLDQLYQVEILQITPFLRTQDTQARPRFFDELSFEIRASIALENVVD